MKQLIVPIAIIVALIAFFVIVDRKEFSRHDDVQTVQSESSTTNRKPTVSVPETKPVTELKPAVETKPVETKPVAETKPMAETKPVAEAKPKTDAKSAETKPVAETKPAEAKPVSETKPTEAKPVETKPAETKPVTQTKPEEKLLPAAVPVVTAEEAEKLNEFALFLATSNVKMTVVEGEITERSELPDPQKSDYPNCRFTVHFTGNTIKSGEPCPKELSLIVEGFENYRVLPSNDIKTGDKVLCTIFPFEQLPEDYQSTQQADDLELFLLESFYVLDIKTIKDFTDNELMPVSGIYFSDGNKEYISLFDRHINPLLPDHVYAEQAFSVRKDIERMTLLLNEIDEEKYNEVNKKFAEAWAKEKAKDPPNYNRVGSYVWRNIDNSFWALPIDYRLLEKPNLLTQETIGCFTALKKACEANGVQLIVSLVPDLHVISARVINEAYKDIVDIQTATYVKQLSESGIETIYASDEIIRHYNRYPFAFFYPENPHPSDTVQDVMSDILAERLKRYEFKPELIPELFSERLHSHVYKDDEAYCFHANCDIGDNQEGKPFLCREILYNNENIPRSKEAQIMIIGNSFIETPMQGIDSLPTLLSLKTNMKVDWCRLNGNGPFHDLIASFLTRGDFFLKNKKALIFHVGTNTLKYQNIAGTITNISVLDNARILLNGKKLRQTFFLESNTDDETFKNEEKWGTLSFCEKSCFVIKNEKEELLGVISFDQNNDYMFNDSQPITCMILTTCLPNGSCFLSVNNQVLKIPSFASAARQFDGSFLTKFYALSFELPAGTKEITIAAEGKIGTPFVIKDIQIWQ